MIENKIPILLRNGNLLVPAAFEYEDVIGDGMVEITPNTEEYELWIEWMLKKNLSPRLAEKDTERSLSVSAVG